MPVCIELHLLRILTNVLLALRVRVRQKSLVPLCFSHATVCTLTNIPCQQLGRTPATLRNSLVHNSRLPGYIIIATLPAALVAATLFGL